MRFKYSFLSSIRKSLLSSYSDVILAAGVICIIMLMILPLPTLLIDSLVAFNLIFAILILLIGIYIPTAISFSTYPSVLLISTLFRLSLSIAITRQILLKADAGHIIETFGKLLIGGNLIVGLVIFLIITTVQFIVIAKGAERVAEVAARFTLDAMPGKQLSIDSDLRSGFIDKDEARRRRIKLQQESHLHGSLDGAMKFVKGESIASIIIVFINLLGGLSVGMLQNGMDFGTAIRTYSLLTIGDGLITQIPALLGAMTAGLIVTRSSDDSQNINLGQSISKEITSIPRALTFCGIIALLMAMIPGFPWLVFILLGTGSIFAGLALSYPDRFRELLRYPSIPRTTTTDEEVINYLDRFRHADPLSLKLSPDLYGHIDKLKLQISLNEMRGRIIDSLGVPIPSVRVMSMKNEMFRRYQIYIFDVEVTDGLINEPNEIETDAVYQIIHQVERVTYSHAYQFMGVQETAALMQKIAQTSPDLIKEISRLLPTQTISNILKNLIEEGVPIRNIKYIFEKLIETSSKEKDSMTLLEFARISLKEYIISQFVKIGGTLKSWVLSQDLEEILRSAIRNTPLGNHLAIDPKLSKKIIEQVDECRKDNSEFARTHVIITTIDLRRHFRTIIKTEHPDISVLSYHEMDPSINLNVSGIISA